MRKCDKIVNIRHRQKSIRVVRECYLREDISCFSSLCKSCINLCKDSTNLLPSDSSHYVIPCFDVLQKYLEILQLPNIRGVIFLQSLIVRVHHDVSKRHYNRILEMVHSSHHGNVIFLNELHMSTHISQVTNQSKEEWLTRCSVVSANWYYTHLNEEIPIILLTENTKIIEDNQSSLCGACLMDIKTYLEKFWPDLEAAFDLYDSITASLLDNVIIENNKVYSNYLSTDVLEDGVKTGLFIQGILRVNKHHAQEEAFVISSKLNADILIPGVKYRNRAIHGDEVVVRLWDKDKWKSKLRWLKPIEDNEQNGLENGKTAEEMPTGEVVGVFQRNWTDYVACFPESEENSNKGMKSNDRVLVIPYDYCIPKIRISTKLAERFQNERIVVRIDNWEVNSQYPNGHFVQSLGEIGKLETEITTLLIEHRISVQSFPQSLLSELPKDEPENPWCIEKDEVSKRLDLRQSHLIFSIDPKGCTDVDDAISVKKLENGKIQLGVHIADITHFVKPSTPIDLEAKVRSTSVYLADRRYDMIPTILSGNVCSLLGGKDRYAVSVLWELDDKCNIVDVWFGRTVIKTAYKLFYEAAQEILDNSPLSSVKCLISEWESLNEEELKEKYEELKSALEKLRRITRVLKKERLQNGGLELDIQEVQFEFRNADTKSIEKLVIKEHLEIHKIVAECMIFANHWVAKRITEAFPLQSVLRCHSAPHKEKLKQLEICASSKGFTMDVSSNKSFSQSLKCASDHKDPSFNQILRMLAIRGMTQAAYISSGSCREEEYYHYGLGLEKYTHFTSPIRRYADILVHRILLSIIDRSEKYTMTTSHLQTLCDYINERHRAAQLVEKDSLKLFQVLYFKEKRDNSEYVANAVIYSIYRNGVLVYLPHYGLKGSVCLLNKEHEVAVVKEQSVQWVPGTISCLDYELQVNSNLCTQTYKLFDHITVRIKVQESHAHSSRLVFDLLNNKPHIINDELPSKHMEVDKTEDDEKLSSPVTDSLVQEENRGHNTFRDDDQSLYNTFHSLRLSSLSNK